MNASGSLAALPIPAGRRVSGELAVPSSKSVTQRYFNLALLGARPLTVERPLLSEDTELFLAALAAGGFRVSHGERRVDLVPGPPPAAAEIFCGNGGTMFRFLTAALATVPGDWRLDGVLRLRERPVAPLMAALTALGARVTALERPGHAPLAIAGGSLRGGRTRLDAGVSSQFLSALLMAGLAAPEETVVEVSALVSAPYVDLTLDAIAELGGEVTVTEGGMAYHVRPWASTGTATTVTVAGDDSTAAYPAAAAALTGGDVYLTGLHPRSRQGDRRFLDLLVEMGAEVTWDDGGVRVQGSGLRGLEADLAAMPDQVPTLAALAPFAAGTTRIRNVPHLRHKESDRLAAMARELRRLGAEVEELADGLVIAGSWAEREPPTTPVTVATYGDHRIAMSLALVGLRRAGVTIADPGVVDKSYPGFWQDLARLTSGDA